MKKLLLLWAIIGVAAAFLYVVVQDIIKTPQTVAEPIIVQIKRGDSLAQIAAMYISLF